MTESADRLRCEALRERGCEVIAFPGCGRIPIVPLLDELSRRSMTNVLVEGGGQVVGSFLDSQQIDAVEIFVAPVIEGGDHLNTPVRGQGCQAMSEALRLEQIEFTAVDVDLRLRGWVPQRWRKIAGFPGG